MKIYFKKAGGCTAILKGYDSVSGLNLLAIGWKFNTDTVLTFLATDGFSSTAPSPEPYMIRYQDAAGNMQFCDIPRPIIVQKHFEVLNCIDVHNHLRQNSLALEENWITNDGNFWLLTSLIGFNVTDTYNLCKFHNLLGPLKYAGQHGQPIPLRSFAGILSHQLIRLSQQSNLHCYSFPLLLTGTDTVYIKEENDENDSEVVQLKKDKFEVVGHMEDRLGNWHTMLKVKERKTNSGKTFRTPSLCGFCNIGKSIVFCNKCNMVLCYPLQCTVVTGDNDKDKKRKVREQKRSCFHRHVEDVQREGSRKRQKTDFIDLCAI